MVHQPRDYPAPACRRNETDDLMTCKIGVQKPVCTPHLQNVQAKVDQHAYGILQSDHLQANLWFLEVIRSITNFLEPR